MKTTKSIIEVAIKNLTPEMRASVRTAQTIAPDKSGKSVTLTFNGPYDKVAKATKAIKDAIQ